MVPVHTQNLKATVSCVYNNCCGSFGSIDIIIMWVKYNGIRLLRHNQSQSACCTSVGVPQTGIFRVLRESKFCPKLQLLFLCSSRRLYCIVYAVLRTRHRVLYIPSAPFAFFHWLSLMLTIWMLFFTPLQTAVTEDSEGACYIDLCASAKRSEKGHLDAVRRKRWRRFVTHSGKSCSALRDGPYTFHTCDASRLFLLQALN
ncbi:hypothetical protein TRVL_08860 [Trypanosoma vivax]|nr:hypothetical protein TRVL_08860 [Trypanosoma vivax]